MIVASLLLIGVAVVLLVLGLWQPSSALLAGSIGASLLAAVVLVVGARQSAAARTEAGARRGEPHHDHDGHHDPYQDVHHEEQAREAESARDRAHQRQDTMPLGDLARPVSPPAGEHPDGTDAPAVGRSGSPGAATMTIPQQAPPGAERSDQPAEEDPPDEPAAQQVSAADSARVGRMGTEVLVVDGRPRYHLPGCVHLLGRESESLPVSEAVELGFTPCSLCEPDSALLADARRV